MYKPIEILAWADIDSESNPRHVLVVTPRQHVVQIVALKAHVGRRLHCGNRDANVRLLF